jgi:hypothetical protein
LVWSLGLVAVAAGPGLAQSGIFRSAPLSVIGSRPTALEVADLDGDSHLDVVVTNTGGFQNTVTVAIGFGDSTFVEFRPGIDVGGLPGELELADFDGDGIRDVAVVSTNEASLAVLLGLGSRPSFFSAPRPAIAVGRAPVDVTSADLNGDGDLDLVTANEEIEGSPGTISVLLGAGNGNFVRVDHEPTVEGPRDLIGELGTAFVVVVDINRDQIPDILALNRTSESVSIFLGEGDGTFDIPTVQAVPGFQHFAVGDVDGDGNVDLAGALVNVDSVAVSLGNGDGTFGPADTYLVGSAPIRVALHDVTDNGSLDIVAANSRSQDVSVLQGNGDGTFAAARTYVADAEPRRLNFGDFDEDGILDIAVVSEGDQGATVAVLRGRPGGMFLAAEDLRVDGAPTDLRVGDINGNGFADLAGVTESGSLFIFSSRGSDGLGARQTIPVGGRTRGLSVVDLNGDLRLDVVVSDFDNGELAVLRGRPDGTVAVISRLAVGPDPSAVATGDFNGDGRIDLATALVEAGEVAVLLQTSNGSFMAARRSPSTLTTQRAAPIDLQVIDADCDGRDDLVVTNNAINTVAVLRSTGNGLFTISNEIDPLLVGDLPDAILVADFDSDGREDFAFSNARVTGLQRSVRFFYGRCDGTFQAGDTSGNLPAGLLVTAMAGRDFTGNQILDIALVNQTANVVKTFLMRGADGVANGSFEPRLSDVVSRMPESITAADFDGDGRYDVAAGNTDASANNVTVLFNCVRDPGCDLFGQVPMDGVPARRGDANDDEITSAADVAALFAEIIDGDGDQVEDVERGAFGAAAGVDANGDGRVDRHDVIAIARRIFSGASG